MLRFVLIVLLCFPSSALASQLVAVLEFSGVGIDDAVLHKMANSARVAARDELDQAAFRLMTRENMVQILRDNELDPSCVEGECEVETGRNIGADVIIAGDVLAVSGQYLLTLTLYRTDSGNLLSAKEAQAADVLKLINNVGPTTKELLLKAGLSSGVSINTASGFSGSLNDDYSLKELNEGVVHFSSTPSGAVVMVDGRLLCSATPCSKSISLGARTVTMQKERYQPAQKTTELRSNQAFALELKPDFGTLSIGGTAGVRVQVDGKELGRLPLHNVEVTPGKHKLTIDDPCYVGQQYSYTAVAGKLERIPEYPLRPRSAGLKVSVTDGQGNDVVAEVTVDGKSIGSSPIQSKVPLCSKELVATVGTKRVQKRLRLREGQLTELELEIASKTKPKASATAQVSSANGAICDGSKLTKGGKQTLAMLSYNLDEKIITDTIRTANWGFSEVDYSCVLAKYPGSVDVLGEIRSRTGNDVDDKDRVRCERKKISVGAKDIGEMLKYNTPHHVVREIIRYSSWTFTTNDLLCLKKAGAPKSVLKEMVKRRE